MTTTAAPRPPDGDWLGTPYSCSSRREGPFGVCTLDRPEARNAMTPAMYFGIRYAVGHVDADPDLAGLLITGTGDVFAPGGDMGGGDGSDNWLTFGVGARHGRHAVRDPAPVGQAGGLGGQRAVPGRRPADRAVQRHGGGQRPRDVPGARAVPRHRRHLLQPDAGAPDRAGPHARPDVHRPHADRGTRPQDWGMVARVVPHDELLDAARDVLGQCCRTAPAARQRGEVQPRQLHGPVRPHRHAGQLQRRPRRVEGFRAFKERRSPDWVHPDLRIDGRSERVRSSSSALF